MKEILNLVNKNRFFFMNEINSKLNEVKSHSFNDQIYPYMLLLYIIYVILLYDEF